MGRNRGKSGLTYKQHMAWCRDQLGGKCVRCGTTERLHIDHVKPRKSSEPEIASLTSADRGIVARELGKCQLLCAGCHAKKTAADRQAVKAQLFQVLSNLQPIVMQRTATLVRVPRHDHPPPPPPTGPITVRPSWSTRWILSEVTPDTRLSDVGLRNPAQRALAKFFGCKLRYVRVDALEGVDGMDLLGFKGFGFDSLDEVVEVAARAGVTVKPYTHYLPDRRTFREERRRQLAAVYSFCAPCGVGEFDHVCKPKSEECAA